MLQTKLTHVNSEKEARDLLAKNRHVVICCGRMGPMCIPVYNIISKLETEYAHVAFADMDFDIPDADMIKSLPMCSSFRGLPFTIYYRDGKPVQATTSIQTRDQMVRIINEEFPAE